MVIETVELEIDFLLYRFCTGSDRRASHILSFAFVRLFVGRWASLCSATTYAICFARIHGGSLLF